MKAVGRAFLQMSVVCYANCNHCAKAVWPLCIMQILGVSTSVLGEQI